MKFTIINNQEGHLSLKGFKLLENSNRFIDNELYNKLKNERGENFVENLKDDFYEGFESICEGEDGKLYEVLFINSLDENNQLMETPFIWQEITKI